MRPVNGVWAFLVGVALATTHRVNYTGSQLWKISVNHENANQVLETLEQENYISLWGQSQSTVDAMVQGEHLWKVDDELKQNGLSYEVSVEDIQKVIDEDNPVRQVPDRKLSWNFYYGLEEIYHYIHHLERTFPDLCSVHVIGRTVEGKPIKLLKISNGKSNNKAVFVEGGVHAREWISPASITYMIDQFVYNRENQPCAVKNLDWYVVPVLNPDGYAYSHEIDRLWRKNRRVFACGCIGVDLNRNFGHLWDKNGSSTDPCNNLFRGPRPFSEPETAAVANFFLNKDQIKWRAYLSVHSYGQYLVYPYGSADEILEDSEEIDAVARKVAGEIADATGSMYTVGPVSSVIFSVSGSSMDWARGDQNIKYPFTIELGDTGKYGFLLPAKFIKSTSEEALTFFKTIAEAVDSSYFVST